MKSLLLAVCALPCLAATVGTASAPVQMVVTVEARRGGNVPTLNQEDFIVKQGSASLKVTDAVALRGSDAALELYILLDDASRWTLGSELANLRDFIEAQPATTAVGVGYMHNGTVETVAGPTTDHARAAKGLRIPTGMGSSPYLSLSELVKRWPASAARHEVIMATSGADPLGGPGPMNPYLESAIADAQRAGVIVYAIYTPGIGHSAHSYYRMNWGQNDLAELTDETGGESYFLGFGAPVSFAPYLKEIGDHLAHQYRVTFLANAAGRPGLKSIKLTTEVPNAEIVAASKVEVPAGP